ncbi:hypothetical protein E4U14_007710 [Claviceps sp. LM454 group G7]|nr:hypothetical protein E4U14_007710 [Claviceps sp. LM454 group G7]
MNSIEIILASYLDPSLAGGDYAPPKMQRETQSLVIEYFKLLRGRYKDATLSSKVYSDFLYIRRPDGSERRCTASCYRLVKVTLWQRAIDASTRAALPTIQAREVHGYIHSNFRNRLQNERVEELVYIYTNARLLRKTTKGQQSSNEWVFDDDSEEGLRGLGLSLDSI